MFVSKITKFKKSETSGAALTAAIRAQPARFFTGIIYGVGALGVIACSSPDLPVSVNGASASADAPSDAPVTAPSADSAVPAEYISLGVIKGDPTQVLAPQDPPYDLKPTEESEKLRLMSLQAQALEAADPQRFYTMSMNVATGEVFAVARSKEAAEVYGQRFAPGHRAPASSDIVPSQIPQPVSPAADLLHAEAVSGGSEDRFYAGTTTHDSLVEVATAGYMTEGSSAQSQTGRCSGNLFAPWAVLTAAHCVLFQSQILTTKFSPRQRSAGNTPYGTGTSGAINWLTAYTAKGCNTTYTYPDCVYYDTAIVTYPHTNSFTNPTWAAFSSFADSTITSGTSRTVGYPRCDASGIPNCIDTGPYGDWACGNTHPTLSHGSTSNLWPYNDGSKPFMSAGCDFTEGQSGSSIFDIGTRSIIAVGVFSDCTDANCVHSVDGPRINNGIFNWMMSFR